MNIGEVIARLQTKAGELPTGYDTELRVSMCDSEGIVATRVLEIDHMAELDQETGEVIQFFAIVQGHPHNDDRVIRGKGVAHDADDVLRQWSDEPEAEPGEPS